VQIEIGGNCSLDIGNLKTFYETYNNNEIICLWNEVDECDLYMKVAENVWENDNGELIFSNCANFE